MTPEIETEIGTEIVVVIPEEPVKVLEEADIIANEIR